MIEKYFIVTSNEVELQINRVRINRSRPVLRSEFFIFKDMFFEYFMIYYAHCLLCLLLFTK